MTLQLLLLIVLVFVSPLFPPVIVPFSFTVIAALLLQHANPWVLTIITVTASTISCMLTWLLWVHLHEREYISRYFHGDLFTRIEKKAEAWFAKREKMNTYAKKLEAYTQKKKGKIVLFVVVVFLFQSAVPDIIGIKFLHKKMSFRMFTLTAILGKAIVYIPVIFLGKTALELVKSRFGW